MINCFNPLSHHLFLFIDVSWMPDTSAGGLGYAIIDSHKRGIIAGSNRLKQHPILKMCKRGFELLEDGG